MYHYHHVPDTSAQYTQIIATLNRLERIIMTEQAHLDADVAALTASFATAVAELKAQIAAGTPPASLDFTALDALSVVESGEATADAPPAPPA